MFTTSTTTENPQKIPFSINIKTQHVGKQHHNTRPCHTFTYTITIQNNSKHPAKLLNRHWFITNANGQCSEVKGNIVHNHSDYIKPGETFTHMCGTILSTPLGCMHGNYQMIDNTGTIFTVDVPPFTLAHPNILH